MTADEVIESFKNAWRALCREYDEYPNESIRNELNFLGKIIRKVDAEIKNEKAKNKEGQISIEEFLEFFKEEM